MNNDILVVDLPNDIHHIIPPKIIIKVINLRHKGPYIPDANWQCYANFQLHLTSRLFNVFQIFGIT